MRPTAPLRHPGGSGKTVREGVGLDGVLKLWDPFFGNYWRAVCIHVFFWLVGGGGVVML